MTAADVIRVARLTLEAEPNGFDPSPFGALVAAAAGDGSALAEAIGLLDGLTPRPWTFFLWADAARWVSLEDPLAGFVFSYDRPVVDILALMGKALVRAERAA